MDTECRDKIISDLQRMSEMVHENSDAVKWAIGMMKIVMHDYDEYTQKQYAS